MTAHGRGVAELEAVLASYDAHACTQVELAAAVGTMLHARGWRWNASTRRHDPPPERPPQGDPRGLLSRSTGYVTVRALQDQIARVGLAAMRLVHDARAQAEGDDLTVSRSVWEVLRTSLPPGYATALQPRAVHQESRDERT